MSCQTIRDQFDPRLDGRLNGAEQAAFDAHLAGCAGCRREWEAYANAWEVLGRHESIEPSFGFAERTLRQLTESPAVVRHPWGWRPQIRWAALATSVAAMAITTWFGHQYSVGKEHAELYARVQEGDYLEDYDVIANLDQLRGGDRL